MLKKMGINTTRAQKNGPNVRNGITSKKFKKIVACSCGATLEKCCENEYVCDVSVLLCPKCGKKIS